MQDLTADVDVVDKIRKLPSDEAEQWFDTWLRTRDRCEDQLWLEDVTGLLLRLAIAVEDAADPRVSADLRLAASMLRDAAIALASAPSYRNPSRENLRRNHG